MSPPRSHLQGQWPWAVFITLFSILGGLKIFRLTEVVRLYLCGNGSACMEMGSPTTCRRSEWSSSGLITSHYQNWAFGFLLENKHVLLG